MPVASASARAAMQQLRGELKAARELEEIAFRGTTTTMLGRRPVDHDWCAAQLNPAKGQYYFCDWLVDSSCAFFQCATAVGGCGRCESPSGEPTGEICVREGAVVAQPAPAEPAWRPVQRTARGRSTRRAPAEAPVAPAPAASEGFALPLGTAFELRARQQPLKESLGSGSFLIDYKLEPVVDQPAIRDEGLFQTYLIFGGPGAGKTHYFKYLLSSLLAHDDRPGCLLLDPKGALTGWLKDVLDDLGRSDDLTVLGAGATQNAFNVLGGDLAPNELGRLLSDVVLAGATVDESWAVLVSDLLESAAVVLWTQNGRLTAAELLEAILYRTPKKVDGKPVIDEKTGKPAYEYPIVLRANWVARHSRDPDAQIASDRIRDFFDNTEPRQRRYVRQIIERSLGDLRSPEWRYLSSQEAKSVYSGIIQDHRVVTVAVGQTSPAFQRAMSTLVKAIFQQAVLADLTRRAAEEEAARRKGKKPKSKPFFILACDEYAQAITEGESGLVSDSRFFSLSREAGCLSLLALQSVATGRSRFPASMHDRWEGILGNISVKLFMRVNDVETAELGSALAGSQHSFVPVVSQQHSAQGLSATEGVTMLEHRRVPPWYLTNRMERGYALVHGTLDGKSVPTSLFVRVPTTP